MADHHRHEPSDDRAHEPAVDGDLLSQARKAGERLGAVTDRAARALSEVESLLDSSRLRVRVWIPVGNRRIRGGRDGLGREITFFLGYSDDGPGGWGIKFDVRPAGSPAPSPNARLLREASPEIRVAFLPHLRTLVERVVGRAREIADAMEEGLDRVFLKP